MIKSTGFLVLSLFIFASLANLSSGNEIDLNEKNQRDAKKEDKHEYYLNRHVDHLDVDAETIQKHGASLEDAKMQADGLLEPKGKKVKVAAEKTEDSESKLQEMSNGEEKQHQRRHHRHEVKGHKKAEGSMESEESSKKEVTKEKKSNKNRKTVESNNHESLKSEEVKVDSSKDTENVKHTGGKRTHDKRRKGHKHGASGHKNRKHGGKKSHKPLKEKKDKKMNKTNHN